jgi:hypothetical protein
LFGNLFLLKGNLLLSFLYPANLNQPVMTDSFDHSSPLILVFVLLSPFVVLSTEPVQAQVGSSQKISNSAGGFGGTLQKNDEFGESVADLGDLNSDGKKEVAVGAPGGLNTTGTVWILSLNSDGTVSSTRQIKDSDVGGGLDNDDDFGIVANAGDVDDDGVTDLAVGAPLDGGSDRGAVWILFLNTDGSVSGHQKISDTAGDFGGTLDDEDWFGSDLAGIGDLDGNEVPDLAVGARRDNDGETNRGAVWILFLESDGTVKSHQKISDTAGNFSGTFAGGPGSERFSVPSALGEVDEDGVTDLAVGAPFDGAGGTSQGAVWILFLNDDGTVKSHQKISDVDGGFGGTVQGGDAFGAETAAPDDLNNDGIPDLLVGAEFDDDGGSNLAAQRGAVWVLYLNDDGTVTNHKKISDTQGGFGGTLDDGDTFGSGISPLGDLNGDGNPDLAVGAPLDEDGAGAVWVTFGDNSALLPVELASLEARRTGPQNVQLRWATASETNNAGFTVQHKSSGKDTWTGIGFVESTAAGGTTTEAQSYRFTAENLSVGTHRFRLKQKDLDGTAHLSDVVTVDLQMRKPVRLTAPVPNPVRRQATLSFAVKETQTTTIRLYNVLGQQVTTLYRGTPPGGESQTVDLLAADLPSGVYFLRLQAGERIRTERLTVVR